MAFRLAPATQLKCVTINPVLGKEKLDLVHIYEAIVRCLSVIYWDVKRDAWQFEECMNLAASLAISDIISLRGFIIQI